MKKRFFSLLGCAALGLAMTIGTTACKDKAGNDKINASGGTKITSANVAKLSKGMTETQVEALFGPPTTKGEVKSMIPPLPSKHTNTWVEGKESLSVTYKNVEVDEFTSTVGSTTSTTTTTTKTE